MRTASPVAVFVIVIRALDTGRLRWYVMAVPRGAVSPCQCLAPGISVDSRRSVFQSTASRGWNSVTGACSASGVIAWSAEMSSMTQML